MHIHVSAAHPVSNDEFDRSECSLRSVDFMKFDVRHIQRTEEMSAVPRIATANGVRVLFQHVRTDYELEHLPETGALWRPLHV